MAHRTILLATDLSYRCDRALDRAVMLAGEQQVRLFVLHVLEHPAPAAEGPSWRRRATDPRDAARQQMLNDLRGGGGVTIDLLVEEGDPAAIIQEASEQMGCELVVLGVPRDETVGRLFQGGIVEGLARKAGPPLLVVKSRPRASYSNVVVATDFSEPSRAALETALALLPAAAMTLFHAFDIPYEGFMSDRMIARASEAQRKSEELQAFLAATPAASGRAVATIGEYGEPGELLQDLVQARSVDLVVLGTAGRTGLAHVLLGSVAQGLLGRLPVDVLLVRRRAEGRSGA